MEILISILVIIVVYFHFGYLDLYKNIRFHPTTYLNIGVCLGIYFMYSLLTWELSNKTNKRTWQVKNKVYNKIRYFAVQCKRTGFYRFAEGWSDLPAIWNHNEIEITDLGTNKEEALRELEEIEKLTSGGG